ncbi:MAG: GntR family transcriptional regulator [Bacteroidota bacterium]
MDLHSKYHRIAAQLQGEIEEGKFEPGEKLPSEKVLCDYYKVSRITVRQALQILEQKELIYRKQGLGAFVAKKSLNTPLVQLTDFSEDMKRAGFSSTSRLISFKKVEPIKEVNKVLDLELHAPLLEIERVRLADEKPVAFDVTWLSAQYGQLLLDEDLTRKTIYQVFEEHYQIPIIAGRYRITAVPIEPRMAEYLNMKPQAPVLEIDRCSRTIGGKKIYFQKRYNNPSCISYELELMRNEGTGSSKEGLPLKEFTPRFF